MSEMYKYALRRLTEYRKLYNMTQAQVAEKVGIVQSHFCKMESGQKSISFEVMQKMSEINWNIDYIITGIEYQKTELDELFAECREEDKSEFLKIIVWAVTRGMRRLDIHTDVQEMYRDKIEFLRLRTTDAMAEKHVWYGIRKANELSQIHMAELINVDIKKYRKLENDQIYPDAAMLTELYEKLNYMPYTTIRLQWGDLNEINRIWKMFDDKTQNELYQYLKNSLSIM